MHKTLLLLCLILCGVLICTAGCTGTSEPAEPTPSPTPVPTLEPTFSPTGLNADEGLSAEGYGTKEFPKVLMKKGPVTFHATFDGPGSFTMDIDGHAGDVAEPFQKRGAFDESVTVDIGSTQYYYVTVTGLGNWTIVQS